VICLALGHAKLQCGPYKPRRKKSEDVAASCVNDNSLPTIVDIGPEEYQDTEYLPTSPKDEKLLAIENTPVDHRTIIVYPNQVPLPPGWQWSRDNELCIKFNEDGTKIVKSIQVHGNCCRFF
jgi:hypothetical protein